MDAESYIASGIGETWECWPDVRWAEKTEGSEPAWVLQQLWICHETGALKWVDVPVVTEP